MIGAVLGYWRARAAPWLARVAEGLWVTLFAVPATIIGIGIISVWNRPGMLGDIYRTDAIVVVAYFSRFLPIGALLCGAFLQARDCRRGRSGDRERRIMGPHVHPNRRADVARRSRGGLAGDVHSDVR